MAHNNAQTYLEALFMSRWTANSVVLDLAGPIPLKAPTQFENVDFEDDQSEYVYRPVISFGQNMNIGIGACGQRHYAKLDVHVFHKPGSGMAVALKACDDIASFFTNVSHSIYEFKEPTVRKIPIDQSGWVQSIVTCPFEFDIWS